jgi:MraZ protein
MLLFLSTYTNKIDKKGRVSVPAPFRSELERNQSSSFIIFPNPEQPCIDAWDRDRIARYARDRDGFDPDSAEYATVSHVLLTSRQLAFDSEGRVNLPDDMIDAIGIGGEVIFAGLGETFQIWSAAEFEKYSNASQAVIDGSPRRIRISPSTGPSTGQNGAEGDGNG